MYEGARVALRAVRSAAPEFEHVRFVLFGGEALAVFVEALRVLEREERASLVVQKPATRASFKSGRSRRPGPSFPTGAGSTPRSSSA